MRYFLRHGGGLLCGARQPLTQVDRQTDAALLTAAIPATTLPVHAASMGPVRQARAPQSVPSFYLPLLASNQDYVSERMYDPNSQVDKSSSLRASASALPGASLATLHLTHPMAMPQAITNAAVIPILECVLNNGGGSYTARFGYENDNTVTETIAVGDSNKFSPTPTNRGQTTTFQVGRQHYVFNVNFNGSNLVWTLKGPDNTARTATASSSSTACPVPVANPGPSRTVATGSTVQLDGTGSTDPSGLPLTYQWSLVSKPSGSTATLSSATAAKPTFVADKTGRFEVHLVVSDTYFSSPSSTVNITAQVQAPVANPGPSRTVATGSTVLLDGTGSTDPAGLPLTYQWSIVNTPVGSTATLSSSTAAKPTFVADKVGTYEVHLVVSDTYASSPSSTVNITAQTQPPIANAGPNQTVTTT